MHFYTYFSVLFAMSDYTTSNPRVIEKYIFCYYLNYDSTRHIYLHNYEHLNLQRFCPFGVVILLVLQLFHRTDLA